MSFPEALRAAAKRRGLELPPESHPEPLAALAYADEVALKNEALAAFWREERLPGQPEPVVPAPVPRGYRTTTKRRASLGPKGLALAFPGAGAPEAGVAPSALDPPAHIAVYEFLLERLSRPGARAIATDLNWVIVRGDAGFLSVVLNVRVFDAPVVRNAKRLAEELIANPLGVRAAFLYLDPTGSEYYLEARRPYGTLSYKRLFGPDWLQVEAEGVKLRFPPTVFSQVNGPMLATMTASARALLAPDETCALLDLYCGYGLFSFTVGRVAAHVIGFDFDRSAIEAARGNAARLGRGDRARFITGRVDAVHLADRLRPPRGPEVVVLDPPRQGTEAGVADAVASRAPIRIVHICCGTEEIPREVAAWSKAGYRLRRALPLDLFAGTASLETLLLLEP